MRRELPKAEQTLVGEGNRGWCEGGFGSCEARRACRGARGRRVVERNGDTQLRRQLASRDIVFYTLVPRPAPGLHGSAHFLSTLLESASESQAN